MNNSYATAAIAQQRRTKFHAEADRERQIRQAGERKPSPVGRTDITHPRRPLRPLLLLWRPRASRSAHA